MRRDEMLGDLPATGGRPDFSAKPEAPTITPECADCGTTEGLTYYPSADEHACAPCSNGSPEPFNGEPYFPTPELGRLGADRVNVPRGFTPPKKPAEPTYKEFSKAFEEPTCLTPEERELVDRHMGPRDKEKFHRFGKAYGMSDEKLRKTLMDAIVAETGIPASAWGPIPHA